MYIYPNSTLYILHNVNLNKDYDHTIYFPRADYQQAFFLDSSKVKYQLDNQSYMRMERGWLKVNKNQNDLWDCTYIVFRNTSYGTKYFYAFINSVEYINDSTSKINFEIDEIQTWWFDYTLDKCFVEREHTLTDEYFENTIPESIDIGIDYYRCEQSQRELFDSHLVMVVSTTNESGVAGLPVTHGNVFGGCLYNWFDVEDTTSGTAHDLLHLRQFLNDIVAAGYQDNVVIIYQYPDFITDTAYHGYNQYNYNFTPNFTTIGTYTPKNKKLFCYPYNYLFVTDKEGNSREYKWEMWGRNRQGQFNIEGTAIGKPVVRLSPVYYKSSSFVLNMDESITADNFPVCAWTGDSYQVWLAQNKNELITNAVFGTIGGAITTAAGLATGHGAAIGRGVTSVFDSIANTFARISDAKHMPKPAKGSLPDGILNMQNETSGFDFKQMTIPDEYAVIIDEYFSRFGYTCGRIKVPNRYARTNWTYTKTVGCEINGNLPSDSADKIKKIYDHGITFWANGNNIGNYGDFTNAVLSH